MHFLSGQNLRILSFLLFYLNLIVFNRVILILLVIISCLVKISLVHENCLKCKHYIIV